MKKVVASTLLAMVLPMAVVSAAQAAENTTDLYRLQNTSGVTLLTTSASEASSAQSKYGYEMMADYDIPASDGGVTYRRFYNANKVDFVYLEQGSNEASKAVSKYGYVDQGNSFKASRSKTDFYTIPIYRFLKGNTHQYATNVDSQYLTQDGWTQEKVEFWVHDYDPVVPASTARHDKEPAQFPADSIFVDPSASTAGDGSIASPYATLQSAIDAASAYSTIVLREGTYHESLILNDKYLSVMGYPGENVVFDGASKLTNWRRSGSFYVTEWTYDWNHAANFNGKPNDWNTPGWSWLNEDAKLAAWPEQVWVNGDALGQVDSIDQLEAGKFYIDFGKDKLYLAQEPTNVTAATIQKAFHIGNENVPSKRLKLEGITFKNYASSNNQMAAGTVFSANVDVTNVTMENMSTSALGLYEDNIHVDGVTITNAGLVGILGNASSGVTIENSTITDVNTQHFNSAPVSGAIKVTSSDNLTIRNNMISNTQEKPKGAGIWCDESCDQVLVEGNTVTNVEENAIFMELSDHVTIKNNKVSDVENDGIRLFNTSNAIVRGNDVNIDTRAFSAFQDSRTPGPSMWYAMDKRMRKPTTQAEWDKLLANYMPWRIQNISIENNKFTTTVKGSSRPVFVVHAPGMSLNGLDALTSFKGNTVTGAAGTKYLIAVQQGTGNPTLYWSVEELMAALK